MRFDSLLAVVSIGFTAFGCQSAGSAASTITECSFIIAKTAPAAPKSAPQALRGVEPGRVLVLSPLSFQQVAGTLTGETTAGTSTAGATASGTLQTTDFNLVVSTAEFALLNAGWGPVSQASLAKMAEESVPGGIAALRKRANATLLEQALILCKAGNASHVLLFRSVQWSYGKDLTGWHRPHDGLSWRSWAAVEMEVDAVLLNLDGEVVWTCRQTVSATDMLPANSIEIYYRSGADGAFEYGYTHFDETWGISGAENTGGTRVAIANTLKSRGTPLSTGAITALVEFTVPLVVKSLGAAVKNARD
jgi:hypothetical protein